MNAVVQLKGVTQVYVTDQQASLAIQDINLNLQQGEFVSLIGPSGCGKTTILSIVAGLITPTIGNVIINGKELTGPSSKVGYMLQQDYLFPWKTIYENTIIGHKLMQKWNSEHKEYTLHLLNEMGLSDTLHQYPHQLSGGMRQRVALVRTLTTKPEIMLLDEPFSALDYQTKLKLEDLVSTTLKEHKKTAFLVTHDISEAIAMSDRIMVMDRDPGRIRKHVEIPDSIRASLPFKAREQEGFHDIFNEIWRELDTMEEKR
jgi:NitT/TauT family transport system ATP-binding protein